MPIDSRVIRAQFGIFLPNIPQRICLPNNPRIEKNIIYIKAIAPKISKNCGCNKNIFLWTWRESDSRLSNANALYYHCTTGPIYSLCPHQESNLGLRFRKPLSYPLNDRGNVGILRQNLAVGKQCAS